MDQPYTIYPEGIGKHIVCIYGGLTATALQTACRGEPRTPNNTIAGNKQRQYGFRRKRGQLKPTRQK